LKARTVVVRAFGAYPEIRNRNVPTSGAKIESAPSKDTIDIAVYGIPSSLLLVVRKAVAALRIHETARSAPHGKRWLFVVSASERRGRKAKNVTIKRSTLVIFDAFNISPPVFVVLKKTT
jgi:hypothetical protein